MRRFLFGFLFLPALAGAQPVTTTSGESKQLCRLWDGTDVALVDGSGNQMVAGTLTCNAGSGTFTISGTVTANQGGTWTVQPGNTANTTAWLVTGTGGTFPITAASLPLPSGASTAAKQPSLGTAGSASSDVLTVQGIASMTALKVDPSAVTSPVSAASLPLPTGAAAEHATAGSPSSARLSDGSAFYDATKTGQLPTALDGSGFLKVHEQGTATVTGPLTDTQLRATAVPVSGTFWQATQPVSGTVTTSPPSNASSNLAQVAGTTADTNSGTKSAGTLRVVLATDQPALTSKLLVTPDSVALPANQSVNVNQLAGTTTDTNSGSKSAGTLRVVLATDQPALTNKLLVTPDANSAVNLAQVAGSTASTAATGVLKVGLVGNAGAAVDAANAATAPANVVAIGAEVQSSALGTSATAGQVRRPVAGLDGVLYTRPGGPLLWSCGVTAIGSTLTQCQAAPAASTSLYVTDITAVSDTATAGAYTLRFGTGTNCATGTTTVYPAVSSITTGKIPYPANTANTPITVTFATPLKLTAANALCVICVATNTCTVSAQGFTAP